MTDANRRSFIQLLGAGAAAGAVPPSIARALAIPAHHRTGTIADVEHVVILMQENRSFDHCFGTLRGVRGFGDPRAIRLPSGKPVWQQPNGSGELQPFRPPVDNLGLTFLPDPPHGWNDTHAAWNEGRMDGFVPNKGVSAMTHHLRHDIPYHFALADAFTVCDAYHCSLMGPTDPNRYHLWTGWVGNDGRGGGPVITNAEAGYGWSTYPERLQRNGITWKVYQDEGDGLNDRNGHWWGWTSDPYIGNYGDNSLLYFLQYQRSKPGEPLYERARTGTRIKKHERDPNRLLDIFRADVAKGTLPQVSWIAAPEAYSEHPNWPADYGAWYVSQVMDSLTAHPEVWSKTVLLIMYDEEGGFFDHMPPPVPPQTPGHGASTVPITNEIYPGDGTYVAAPYGLGMRVPMMVVSPWSKGGWVNSQVFDHTSVIRFLEARFANGNPDLIEHNITPWRRAVAGDLTSAFDFSQPHPKVPPLPDTSVYFPPDFERHNDYPVQPPGDGQLPRQEAGLRRARALPYALLARARLSDDTLRLRLANIGQATAVFHVRSADAGTLPRSYTVEPGKRLAGEWAVAAGRYALAVHGPNGFHRAFEGQAGAGQVLLEVSEHYDADGQGITLQIVNAGPSAVEADVEDRYTGQVSPLALAPGQGARLHWQLDKVFGWYDLVVTVRGDEAFRRQLAGHIESGRPSFSDPAMGGLRLKA